MGMPKRVTFFEGLLVKKKLKKCLMNIFLFVLFCL